MKKDGTPKITVLMATYNGDQWLSEQVESILNQRGVDVKLIVSDDMSTDGTIELLENVAKNDHRILILPSKEKFGSASKNFYRLVIDADISDCDYVAFSDQDDIWLRNKLFSLAKIANDNGADGVSSNVVAFWRDGSRALLEKSKPLRKLDFIFESAGPGSTYLMSPMLIRQARAMLIDPNANVNQVKAYDWLIYAICRSSGRKWCISSIPTVKYRQHDNNELGVNLGVNARWTRIQWLHSGRYKTEVIKISEICRQLTSDSFVQKACAVIINKNRFNRFTLLVFINHFKRSIEDRIILGVAIVLNIL